MAVGVVFSCFPNSFKGEGVNSLPIIFIGSFYDLLATSTEIELLARWLDDY